MAHFSFSLPILLFVVLHSLSHNSITATVSHNNNRETLEIVIGGGGIGIISPESPPPESPADCPPPPPPPCPPPPPPPVEPPPTKKQPSPNPPKPKTQPTPRPPAVGISANLLVAGRILRNFGKDVGNDPKHIIATWKGDDPCKYTGVVCRYFQKMTRVVGIKLNGARFDNKTDAKKRLDLNNLIPKLQDLAFYHGNSNNLTGMPKGISKLKNLFELDLSNNIMAGTFPEDLLSANELSYMDLRFNQLYGPLPSQVFKLYLDVLFLNNNKFSGHLPENLGDLRALYITFANNFFTGEIPSSIGKCPKLVEVLFLNNSLSGCLPYEIGKLHFMKLFDASMNQLTGPIPHSFACLERLELMNLAQNKMYGPVPEMLCKLGNLQNLTLNNNYFTEVGPECRKLISKKILFVNMNCILDLPNQRTAAECKSFFSMHRSCPDESSMLKVDCKFKTTNTPPGYVPRQATAPSPSPSYAALEVHH